tara:strand:- start:5156 stop:5389 length:234 start_codon:yes stop_codon:yes gene_type:complete
MNWLLKKPRRKLMQNIEGLTQKLKQLKVEIKAFQESCNHPKKQIRTIKPNDTKWVCTRCEKPLSWPTDIELQYWFGS